MRTYSMRQMYGETLVELGEENPRIVVLEADLAQATKTHWFRKKFPERFIEVGIAEQNMMSIGAGLALSGKIPFVTGLAVFVALRACEQLRTSVALAQANVKVVGQYGGLCTAENGPTHQCISDLGITRSIPGLKVLAPADAYACRALVRLVANVTGPSYLRVLRDGEPVLYDGETAASFRIGGAFRIREGRDISLLAHGFMVQACLSAADALERGGISASVVDVYSLKPIDRSLIVQEAGRTGAILTVEEHNVFGGLGSAVAEVLASEHPTCVRMLGLQDEFGVSGQYTDLLKRYGLSPDQIAETAKSFLRAVKPLSRRVECDTSFTRTKR